MGSSTRAGFFRPLRVSPPHLPGLFHPSGILGVLPFRGLFASPSRPPFGKPCPSFPWPGSLVSRAPEVGCLRSFFRMQRWPRYHGSVHSRRYFLAETPRVGSFAGCWPGLHLNGPKTGKTSRALPVRFPSSLARVGKPSSLSRAGIQGLEPRVRAWSRGGIQPLAGTRTSLGFPALQGLTTWTVRWISPVRSPLALGRTAQVVPEPQGINGSSSRQGICNIRRPCGSRKATPATCLALVGFLPSCSHQSLRPWSVRAYLFRLGVRSALPPRHPPFLKRSVRPAVPFYLRRGRRGASAGLLSGHW